MARRPIIQCSACRPEIAEARRETARHLLPAPLANLVCGTSDIFMQVRVWAAYEPPGRDVLLLMQGSCE